jgi:UDP-N-acetylglucosamine 2-epimerase
VDRAVTRLRRRTVVGARPQFVKAAALTCALRHCHTEILVHNGQHYDDAMSGLFFRELGLPRPDHISESGPPTTANRRVMIRFTYDLAVGQTIEVHRTISVKTT